MNNYKVSIQIYKNNEEYAMATFEIVAKDETAAIYRITRLFKEEVIADGDGYKVLEVRGGKII